MDFFDSRSARRGSVRGFFALATLLWAVGCEKAEAPPKASTNAGATTAGKAATDVGAAPAADAGEPDVAVPETQPVALAPPWQTPFTTLDAIKTDLPAEPVGTLSGEIFGENRKVRGVARMECGAGAVVQLIYEGDKGELLVTPGMGIRFLDLPTGDAVTYEDKDFEITTQWKSDTPDRLAGNLTIKYGTEFHRTYATFEVDAKPLGTLLEPKLDGKGNVPLFESCFSNGYMLLTEADGTEHRGYLNATRFDGASGGALIVKPLLTPNSGLKVVMGLKDKKKPLVDRAAVRLSEARDPTPEEDVVVFVEAWYLPELAPAEKASGVNLGSEERVNIREGSAQLNLTKQRGKWYLELTLTDLRVPTLIDGPLRGKVFKEVRIAAWPNSAGTVTGPHGEPPEWWTTEE